MSRKMLIGRFQPVHKGHIETIERLLEDNGEELIIVVAAAQYSHTYRNPFTCSERIEMLLAALDEKDVGRDRYLVIPVQDINDHYLWPYHVDRLTPSFDELYTNNKLVQMLFQESGFKTQEIGFYEQETWNGTYIRESMIKDDKKWEEMVMPTTVELLKRIDAVSRIKLLVEQEGTESRHK